MAEKRNPTPGHGGPSAMSILLVAGISFLSFTYAACKSGHPSGQSGPARALNEQPLKKNAGSDNEDAGAPSALKGDNARKGYHTIYGLLIRRNPSPGSEEAYRGAEFFLHDPHLFGSGLPFVKKKIVLFPSSEVPREELLKRNHEFVTVTVVRSEGTVPDDPNPPTDAQGNPMRQGEGWKVIQILPD